MDLAAPGLFRLFRAHPWHGVDPGQDAAGCLNAYIELVPADTIKYELDKETGLLRVDRPQKFSSLCPTPYGFVPRTWCGPRTGRLAAERSGRTIERGDGDPLDICVLTERRVPRGDLLLRARPVGGLRMIDHGEADDKIVAVLADDAVFGGYADLAELPAALVERLRHYFLTYKQPPGELPTGEIAGIYGRREAWQVIDASRLDYDERFAELAALWRGISGS
ncbi:MAG: inorganic pyrophosphatase [Acidobacteria bacterium]|nr:inorganic pyrophosphatase [Acidobacteriota bacterium]